jgi:uncharacterized Ntn-hydrolase superfamily protein
MKPALLLLTVALCCGAQTPSLDFLNHNRPVLDAHNCYPDGGQWSDRIERALSAGFPVGIEQDLTWYVDPVSKQGRAVVAHNDKPDGSEPLLRDYFFERVRPIVEKALTENQRAKWPLIVLHFDFKSNQPALHRAIWDLLGEYQAWITTAEKTADTHELTQFNAGPLLVLTEDNDAQEEAFFGRLPVGGRLRIFGSAHTKPLPPDRRPEWNRLLATLPPEQLLSAPPTTYRRWWNLSWYAVERDGQRQAGDWTDADNRRLTALVDHAHKLGYWIRFYTLDGFAAADNRGWSASYNFGSPEAAALRWKAALDAGVNLIATDHYEALGKMMHERRLIGRNASGPRELEVNTFSIVGYDPAAGDWGVAVASRYFSVGAVVPWAEAGTGAIATQANVNVGYGPHGLELLRQGLSAKEVLAKLLAEDQFPPANGRQVAIIDGKGNIAAHTGPNAPTWAGDRQGKNWSAQGNILVGPQVVEAMGRAFEATEGELSEKLFAALKAGDDAGGDSRGKQSASMLVVRKGGGRNINNDRYVYINADDNPQPIPELRRLLDLNLGLLYQEKSGRLRSAGKNREARDASAAAARYMPTANAFLNLGLMDYNLGDKASALTAFRKALQLDASVKQQFDPQPATAAGGRGQRMRAILEDSAFLKQLFPER